MSKAADSEDAQYWERLIYGSYLVYRVSKKVRFRESMGNESFRFNVSFLTWQSFNLF